MAINVIGVMTGNSLDAVDVVLTVFDKGMIKDLAAYTLPYPQELRDKLLKLRALIKEKKSEMAEIVKDEAFEKVINEYTTLVAKAVNKLFNDSGFDKKNVAAIGFHGQTCDHFPPSIAKGQPAYTLQVGNPQLLADLTDLPVIYDFRSDDIMNGGEGAPLAPLHNLHIAEVLKRRGVLSMAFCNGGNTGNIAVISQAKDVILPEVVGWDTGPFNHFPDKLMRDYKNLPCDKDGEFGKKGVVQSKLLKKLFDNAAVTNYGSNFYNQQPPRSSDPNWYNLIYDNEFSFEDNLRTAEYLSAYTYVYSLNFVQKHFLMPSLYLLFGGGWKNPLIKKDFEELLTGNGIILPEHEKTFADIWRRIPKPITIDWADNYGFSGEYMEARIFADMAYCKIINEPFSIPSTTNCRTPTIGGIFVYPQNNKKYLLEQLLLNNNNQATSEKEVLLWSRSITCIMGI